MLASHPIVASPVAEIAPVIEVSHPIVAVLQIVAVHVAEMLPVISVLPPIVVAHPISAVHEAEKSHVIEVSPVMSVLPAIEVSPVIVTSHVTVRSSFRVVVPVTSAFPPTDKFCTHSISQSTVSLPVISTSHKYHARAEKSPWISVQFDRVNVYCPSNGSESGLVSDIDSSLTSSYCGTCNPWLLTNLTSM